MSKKFANIQFKCSPIDMSNLGALCFELYGPESELVLMDKMVEGIVIWSASQPGGRKIFSNSLAVDSPYEALLELERITNYKLDLKQPLIWLSRCF